MPVVNQDIGATAPKTGTFQYDARRLQGVTLKLPSGAAYTSISNRRIVSLQEQTSTGNLYAVPSPVAESGHIIVGWGVLEEALQSGGIASIAPSPNNFVEGDQVVVLRDCEQVYQIDTDGSNTPTHGINTAYMNVAGQITSVSSGSNLALSGAVFTALPGVQMANQLLDDCVYYQMFTPVKP